MGDYQVFEMKILSEYSGQKIWTWGLHELLY